MKLHSNKNYTNISKQILYISIKKSLRHSKHQMAVEGHKIIMLFKLLNNENSINFPIIASSSSKPLRSSNNSIMKKNMGVEIVFFPKFY